MFVYFCRCLLSRDLIRLGRWFVLPYEGIEEVQGKSPHLSFLFSFFVHGESTVCASVDVRQHPPVRTLSPQVLQQAQSSQAGVPGMIVDSLVFITFIIKLRLLRFSVFILQ